MNIAFPSPEFDEAVAAVCHGLISEGQARALNELLRENPAARDEYILRLELHARLASDPDLIAEGQPVPVHESMSGQPHLAPWSGRPVKEAKRWWRRREAWAVAAVALLLLTAIGWWRSTLLRSVDVPGTTSMAVAMLDRAVDAKWATAGERPQLGGPLEPGALRLESGMVQVVFYSGARVVIEGPAEFGLVGPDELSFRLGRLTAEVAPQAVGFRVVTPQARVTDVGTAFGLDVTEDATELHVFEGKVELEPVHGSGVRVLEEGTATAVEESRRPRPIFMDAWKFASLFELQQRSVAAEASRYERWRQAGERLNDDPSLLVRLDFEGGARDDWRLLNACKRRTAVTDGTVIGCQWTNGRWPDKRALEFQSVNDRVRLSVPGEFESLTLAMWVRVQGLDRRINSLFMSDGFAAGTIHWSIRNDGVLGLTLIGPGVRNYEIVATPPVLTLDRLGMWVHLAVVVDGPRRRVVQYVDGFPVGTQTHRMEPPFTVGESELGNWNAEGFPGNDPFLIRNFSGAMDEFCLFARALGDDEIRELYRRGKPQPDSMAQH